MDIRDLSVLKIDPKTNLYDLTQLTHKSGPFKNLIPYTIKQEEEMRVDLICKSIYRNEDNIDVILYCNSIDNPLNFLSGATIYYPSIQDVEKFRYEEVQKQEYAGQMTDVSKSRSDKNRQSYVDQNYSLSPTLLPSPTDQVKIDGNNLVIGSGLF